MEKINGNDKETIPITNIVSINVKENLTFNLIFIPIK